MPLYMDRHDVPGATAKDIAEAHLNDLEVAGRHGVQFLSYWFDAESGGAFCFAHAPDRENLQAVHHESHGLVANEIIAVSESDVLRFLGRIRDPADHTEITSAFRTIMFTDLVGSTALLEAAGEAAFMRLLDEHDVIVRRAVVTASGREVKHTGDGIMASFDAVGDALDCAQTVRRSFVRRNAVPGTAELHVRVGLAAGQPVDHNDDLYGATVVLASRICDIAAGGQVLVSDVVREKGTGFSFGEPTERSLKGFSQPVRVYELLDTDP
jgi:class 3 adenylate cyclase